MQPSGFFLKKSRLAQMAACQRMNRKRLWWLAKFFAAIIRGFARQLERSHNLGTFESREQLR
jgi:hypothetical protein